MKQADVKLAGVYLTRVSGELVRVLVRGIVGVPVDIDYTKQRYRVVKRYLVQRIDTKTNLPKPRSAAALRLPD
jgi:hypothetical protein